MYDDDLKEEIRELVTGPCEFLVMYDGLLRHPPKSDVTGPCEFLVMYDINWTSR